MKSSLCITFSTKYLAKKRREKKIYCAQLFSIAYVKLALRKSFKLNTNWKRHATSYLRHIYPLCKHLKAKKKSEFSLFVDEKKGKFIAYNIGSDMNVVFYANN